MTIPRNSFHAVKNRSVKLLVSRGYEPVQPVTASWLSHYIPLHLIGLKGDYEALCVKLRIARGAVSEAYVESFCRYDLCQFRTLLLTAPGNVFLRCEVWVVSPNGSIHCYEVLSTSIREVASYAR
jgi:hypothetical protein